MLLYLARKVFGTRNDRVLKSLKPLVQQVNEQEERIKGLSDDDLKAQTVRFKEQLDQGATLEDIQAEAFAVVREASRRVLDKRHYDVQLIGGAVLHMGRIAEMRTGEGKTLVATLPAYLNGLTGKGVHIVTVNDYLARRDAEWMGTIYKFLGLSVGVVYAGMPEAEKKAAYQADITYGQNNEFGFDYLRDNMRFSLEQMYQRSHYFAIVDEVDSILIDEARTPLIISGPAEEATDKYLIINRIIPHLERENHFEIDLKSKSPSLTEAGIERVEALLQIDNLYDPKHLDLLHHVQQGLGAHYTKERDVDYVVRNGEIIIVDEFTGRLMPGRRWSNGLHQAIEAKEGVQVHRENKTLASITFQNYFRMYDKLSGMTGTADTEAVEFKQIYNLEVVVIPTNRPMQRTDLTDVVYRNRQDKYLAVCESIEKVHATGQPILVGTVSIEQSEALAQYLQRKNIPHNVLNAKQHEREAEIVAQAGRLGAVTISTNMAGRGTDILLGGNPEFMAFAEAGVKDHLDPTYKAALEKYNKQCAEEREKVVAAGGLFIMGTERHESRRIDNQLRGRAGRQGDPGTSQFFISLEDDLMMRFGGDRLKVLMQRLGWEEGVSIDGNIISKSIESAQKRVEAMHFESRKHVTEYDDVMNKQRQVVYALRSKILKGEGVREEVLVMIEDLVEDIITVVCRDDKRPMEWDLEDLKKRFEYLCNAPLELPSDIRLDQQTIFDFTKDEALKLYAEQAMAKDEKLHALAALSEHEETPIVFEAEVPNFSTLEQRACLEFLDHFWNVHLQDMEDLREGIHLRGYGQKNPLYEYQKEGFTLFENMLGQMKEAIVRKIFFEEIIDAQALLEAIKAEAARRQALERQMQMVHEAPGGEEEGQEISSATTPPRSPEEQRAKLEAMKKERRKMK